MLLPNTGIENHPTGTGDLNAIVNGNWGQIESFINQGYGFTASQALLIVTASAPIFTTNNIGDTILWASGSSAVVQATGLTAAPSTTCTVSISQTVAAGSFFLYRAGQTPFTALLRGLMKTSTAILNAYDSIMWNGSFFVPATGFGGFKTGTIFTGTANAVLTNSSAVTLIAPTGIGTNTIPANYLAIGKRVRFRSSGLLSTKTPPGNLQVQLTWGATAVFDTTSLTPPAGLTNAIWFFDGEFTCRTTGAAGTVMGQGRFTIIDATGNVTTWPCINTAVIVINQTANAAVKMQVTFGTADPSNTFTITDQSIEILN